MTKKDQILSDALTLSPSERADVAKRLIQSLGEAESSPTVEASWVAELQRRLDDVLAGKVRGVPAEEVHREARERLRRAR